ncbi:MAG: protein kinase [Anaeromyxobacteraceae bacterium]
MPTQEGTLTRLAREVFAQDGATASSWDGALHAGAVVGRFELVRELGRGGFGSVWEARDTRLKRRVAFKAVEHHALADADEAALAEAEAAAHLSHPNIVTLFDVGRSEHGPYLVMELLSGRSVRDATRVGPLAAGEALRVAIEVLRGLEHAHGKGILHRDLTPANVFLCDDGAVKLLDLGLSRALAGTHAPVPTSAGTPGYAPPERLRGEPEDARSDLFGVGALLLLMLSGKKPGDDAQADARRLKASPTLARLVERLLDSDPSRRPASAAEVRSELERIRERAPDVPAPTSAPGPGHRARPTRAIAVLATFMVAASVAFLIARIARPATKSAPALSVTLAAPIIGIGGRTHVTAFSVLPDGKREPLESTTWRSTPGGIVAIDAQGAITGRAPGTAQIAASARDAEGSNSIVVAGPEWQLVHASDMAPPPDGYRLLYGGREGAEGQGAAIVHGRTAWRQTSDSATLQVPIPLPAGVDRYALQVDFWAPLDAKGRQSLEFVPFDLPTRFGGGNLDFAGSPGWRTIRVEGSRENCSVRYLVDGTEISTRGGFCDPGSDTLTFGAISVEDGTTDVAWSNLRVFQGTPVASVPVTIQRLSPGAETFARAHATPSDAAGNSLPGCTIRWTSSDPSIATVDSSGAIRALRRGEVTITATTEGKTGSARLRVDPPAPATAPAR